MNRVRVKICGLKSEEEIVIAVNSGADAVGFVVEVPDSPRNLSIRKAERLIQYTPVFVEPVIVTVPKDMNHLQRIFTSLKPKVLQIHGSGLLQSEIREKLPKVRIIRAVKAKGEDTISNAKKISEESDAIIFDTCSKNKHGGTGITHDWTLSNLVRKNIFPKPLILAGGLQPNNVKEAIRIVQPYAVDVSSGVEFQPGLKDPIKIFEFIKNAKEIDL